MKKLYYVTGKIDVVFGSEKGGSDLNTAAANFLFEEAKNGNIRHFQIKEIEKKSDIPSSWENALPWGFKEESADKTTIEWFESLRANNDSEYKEYLRLKKKFENE